MVGHDMERDVERALTDGLTQVGDGAGPPVASMLARVWLGEVPPPRKTKRARR